MSDYYTILTNTGSVKLAQALASGQSTTITTLKLGDGNGSPVTPSANRVNLVRTVWSGAVNQIYQDPINSRWVVIEAHVPVTSGNFTVREVGLFDAAGDMIAHGNYPATFKPLPSHGIAKDLYIRVIIEVADAASVTLTVDPSAVMASQEWVSTTLDAIINPLSALTMQNRSDIGAISKEIERQRGVDDSTLVMTNAISLAIDQLAHNQASIAKTVSHNGAELERQKTVDDATTATITALSSSTTAAINALEQDNTASHNSISNSVGLAIDQLAHNQASMEKSLAHVSIAKQQQGITTIYNRGRISGVVLSKDSVAGINLSAGIVFGLGRIIPVTAQTTPLAINSSGTTITHKVYLTLPSNNSWPEMVVAAPGDAVPLTALELGTIVLPNRASYASDADWWNACSVSNVSRIESEWPTVQSSPAYTTVTMPRPLPDTLFHVALDATSWSGGGKPIIIAPESDRAKNTFRVYSTGLADAVVVRWLTHSLNA